ncbi:MAG: hypothetical protein L6R42_003265 [Xanthoria sp. 1 TBL-2021]|nr:MAG: hypothetical protein L6R42_003265 [Xanthoria sp. 1 TBL-2021]
MPRGRRGLAEANEAPVTGASQTHLEALNSLEELRSRQCLTSFLDSWLDPFPSENGISRLKYVEEWCNRRTTDARDAHDAQLARDRAHRAEERDAARRRQQQEAERRRQQEAERRREREEEAERLREREEERLREEEIRQQQEEAERLREREETRQRQEETERLREREEESKRLREREEIRQRQEEAERLRKREETRQRQEETERLREREEEAKRLREREETRQRQEEAERLREREETRQRQEEAERLREQDKAAERRERDTEILRQQKEPGPSGPAPQQVDDIGKSRSGNSSQEANEEGESRGSRSLLEDSVGDNASAANDGGQNSSSDNSGANTSQRGGGPNSEPRRTDSDGISKLLHAAGLPESHNHQKEVSQGLHPPRTPNPHPYPVVGLGLATPSPTPMPSSNKRQRAPALLPLTSVLSGKDVIQRTMGLLKSGPDGHELSPDKAKRVCELFESLFSVKAWWELHCCMTSYVEASGFCKAETQEESDRRDSIVSLASSDYSSGVDCSSSPGPGQHYLKDFVLQWRSLRHFSNNTLKPGLTTMKKMRYEEHLYVYWRRLLQVWTSYHIPRDDNRKGDVEDDEPGFELDHSPDEADHLMRILHQLLEERKYELGLTQPHTEIAHTSMLLKRLVAPLLGFRVADNNFDQLFSNTLSNAIVRKGILRIIGPKLLTHSLPRLTRDHPSLRTCLDTVNEIFLNPLSEGKQLDYERVGTFLRIRSKDELFNFCEGHKDGLSGLFSSGESPTELNIEPESGSLGVGTTSALTGDVEETCTNRGPECDEDEEPVFDIRELLAEEGRRDGTTQPSGTRDANGTRGASGQGDGPTTPPTTRQKRSRDANRATPESPSKRRG